MDTIYALATAPGRAGIAVVRLSRARARAHDIAESLAGPLPRAGRSLRWLRHDGEVLDQALVLTFAKGASFTGEEVVELHLHGSSAVVQAVLSAIGRQEGARPAVAGELPAGLWITGGLIWHRSKA
jgi:tRNA modification GTPase